MKFIKGNVVVIDRGYLDIKWLNNLDSSGCFFVIREKSNMVFEVKTSYQVEGDILSDEDIILSSAPPGGITRRKYAVSGFWTASAEKNTFF